MAEPLLRLGNVLLGQERFKEAEPFLQAATKLDAADPASAYNLGLVRMYQRQYEVTNAATAAAAVVLTYRRKALGFPHS